MRSIRVLTICLAFTSALAAPGVATAATSGRYTGKLYSWSDTGLKRPLSGTKVSFKVKGNKVRTFAASGGIKSCSNFYLGRVWTESLTFAVPSAPIKRNRINKTYEIRKDGDHLGTNKLKGRFRAKRASGTLEQKGGYCTSGYRWSVKRR